MRELPYGTVTFLFTDIEGSTRLLHELGDDYADALAAHRRVLRDAFLSHGGIEVDTQGDAFFVAFTHAEDALSAASDGQRALSGGPIHVRMGLHTGDPAVTDEGYVGIDVHRAARIAAVAHGGQVVLSERTRDLLDGAPPLRDLGLHRLKDLGEPEHLYQLGEEEFPPLRSLNATNLPAQSTTLIGREREVAEILALVRRDDVRLLTLTGAGGSGKTRLALQAAAELVDDFRDGVFWVSLAAVEDPQLVLPTIATTVGAKEELASFTDEKRLLLLLDNLEQVLPCGAALAGLLRCCPNLKLLVTSRAALRVSSEQEYEVAPLPETDAVELFTQRARRIKPAFEPDAHVTQICRRLDGLPLAVELAAARAKLLSPRQILERLGSSLELLTSGARDLPARQQTLRATIEWSYELLDAHEQELFVRLAVFAGSFDLEAAEAVCDAELDLLEALVDESLLRQTDDGRFFMLATVREFGIERVADQDDSLAVRDRHATYFVDLAEAADSELHGVAQRSSHGALKRELPNLRTALSWALKHDPELAGQLSGALAQFWFMHGGWSEGEAGAEAALSREGLSEAVRIRVLFGSALLGVALQDGLGVARANELLELAHRARSRWGIGRALMLLGWNAALDGEYARAGEAFRQCLAAAREAGDGWLAGVAMHDLADVALNEGNYDQARRLLQQSVGIARARGDDDMVARSTADLGQAALRLGRREEAIHLFRESLRCGRELDAPDVVAADLTGLAAAIADRDAVRAARLLGAADATVEDLGAERQRTERATRDDAAAALLRHLPAERLNAELAAGAASSREEAIEAALSVD
jgi:predicted ATPase/class 3 adenylate cyclase